MANPFAKRLKQARLAAGISQKQLGIQAGIDQFAASTRINQYERGVHAPKYEIVAKMSKILKVPVPFFYTADNNMAEMIRLAYKLPASRRKQIAQNLKQLTIED